jgi:hypothetical protein
MISTPTQFMLKIPASDDQIDIPHLTARNATFARVLGAEKLQEPNVGRQQSKGVGHVFLHDQPLRNEVNFELTSQGLKHENPNCRGEANIRVTAGIYFGGQNV